jgi:putative addiction module component (TIGR02574 family)
MTSAAPSLESILAGALLLPEQERAVVAAELLASLHPEGVPLEDDPGWRAEVERRAERVRRGESDGLAWEDVLAELEHA